MATQRLTLTLATKSDSATQRVVTATLTYYGNGVSYSGYDCPATITFNGTKKSWSSTIHPTTSTSAQVVKTQDFTITKTHSAQSLTGSATFTVTGTSLGTMSTTSSAHSVTAKTSYTVSYAANGGSGTTTAQTKWYGESLTLRGALTKTGYTFSKWKATNGTTYSAGASYTANAATTMTAQWTANTYYVKFNANGGSGSMSNETFTYGVAKALTKNAFNRTGYTFNGWKTGTSSGTSYSNGQSVSNLTSTAGGTVNLYAQWTANTYYVKFNANGGSGSMANQTFTYGAAKKALTKNTFTRTGYTFNGWKTAVSSGTSYTDSQSVSNLTSTANAIVNLYAQWTPVIYIITLDNQSATSAGTATYYEKYATGIYSDSTATTSITSITVPSKDGYKFGGYYTATNGDGIQYIDSSGQITATNTTFIKNTTLYALWIEAYIPPKITNVRIVRCTASGTETLSGDYAKLSFNWTAGIAQDGTVNNNTNISIVATINDGSENGTEIEYNETGLTEESGVIENNISSSSIPYSNPGSIVITILDVAENQSFSITTYIPEGGFPIHISQKENNITLFGICDENKQGLIINNNIEIKGQTNQYIKLQNNLLDVVSNMRVVSKTGKGAMIKLLADGYNDREILYSDAGNFGFFDRSSDKWLVRIDKDKNVFIPEGTLNIPKSIVHGDINITPSAANTPTAKAVTWSAMGGIPSVTVTALTTVPGTQVTGVAVVNRSTTGCNIYVTRTNTTAFSVSYIAIY